MSSNNHPVGDPVPVDFNRLLRANLQRVFNERDPVRRAEAIAELYSADPTMYEPDAVIDGREAISAVAGKLLDQFGPEFRFTPETDAVGHHGVGSMRWRAGTLHATKYSYVSLRPPSVARSASRSSTNLHHIRKGALFDADREFLLYAV